jgi:aminocarboxymuconate-semialdehyde decarboxylase
MPNRRDFFRTVAGATAGALVGSAGLALAGQGRQGGRGGAPAAPSGPVIRRQVTINGKRIRVVDIHAHATVPEVGPVVAGTPFADQAGGRNLDQERVDALDRQGIDIQVLSINGFWWYEVKDRDLAGRIVKAQNEGLAKFVSTHPDRFAGMASTSLQFPDLAAQQLEDGVKRLGLRAAAIGGHVNGEDLSNPKYDTFWAKAAELGVIVFMHPGGADNIIRDGALRGRGDLGNIIGNPLETTYFLERLIYDGTLDRFPGLKVGVAHAGGYLPAYLGRAEVACDVRPNAMCANKKKPSEYLKTQILADTMILSDEGLRHLVAVMGPSQVVYGTDNPLNWPVTVDLVLNASYLNDAQKEMILGGNLLRLLKITS